MHVKRPWRYFVSASVGIAAGVVAAFLLAIILAIVDLYLSGHSRPTLSRAWLSVPEWGISLSRADVILLSGAFLTAVTSAVLVARSCSTNSVQREQQEVQ